MFSSILLVLVKFWPSVFTQSSCCGNALTPGLNKKPPNYRQSKFLQLVKIPLVYAEVHLCLQLLDFIGGFNHISQHLKLLLHIYVAIVEQTAADRWELVFMFLEWMKSKAEKCHFMPQQNKLYLVLIGLYTLGFNVHIHTPTHMHTHTQSNRVTKWKLLLVFIFICVCSCWFVVHGNGSKIKPGRFVCKFDLIRRNIPVYPS